MQVENITGPLHKFSLSLIDQSDAATVNVVASVGSDGILLVDAGWAPTAEKLNTRLRELGDGNVKLIIITHPHLDHHGGSGFFKEQATLIAHKNAIADLSGRYFALGELPEQELPVIQTEDGLALLFERARGAPGLLIPMYRAILAKAGPSKAKVDPHDVEQILERWDLA